MPLAPILLSHIRRCLNLALITALLVIQVPISFAADRQYQVDIKVESASTGIDTNAIKVLLEQHLQMIEWRDNTRMTTAEWQRLFTLAPDDIQKLLATEGYFSPVITSKFVQQEQTSIAQFDITLGNPATISKVDIQFSGAIIQANQAQSPNPSTLRDEWLLPVGEPFRQESWTQAKRKLLTRLLVERYPNASISSSLAEVNVETNTVALKIEIDSGNEIHFGELTIEGLNRYSRRVVNNINPIKPSAVYTQSDLLTFQTRLQESGYFSSVSVTADSKLASENNQYTAPIKVVVVENKSIKVGLGAGYSTNTGARTQVTFDDLNLMGRDWRFTSALKVEQKAQSLVGQIQFPITKTGYSDSLIGDMNRTNIEGQTLTATQLKVRRAWGPRKREQYVGANYLIEEQDVDGGETTTKRVATLNYGITLRRTDNDLAPTRGYLANAEFAYAPLESLSNGQFLYSRAKTQIYYPITNSTQLIARAELGMVNGKNSAPEAFLFRAGGDQSVRGYAFQSLGIKQDDAIVGGKLLATSSLEVVQWLTHQWGAALFVDAGNAANEWKDLKPVYGYGVGVRWKSPLGPIGADIAYGEEVHDYRLHFNIGVAF
jgi:translocation and assembly module TamA